MKTILIQVDQPPAGSTGAYPVSLRFDEGNGLNELATGSVPADLGVPPKDANGDPFDADSIVDLLMRQSASASFADIGLYLFRMISDSGIGSDWSDLRRDHRATKEGAEGLRTVFDVKPSLGGLPWELMMEQEQTVPIFLDKLNPTMRGTLERVADDDLPPLRLLLVVGNRAEMEEETVEILAAVNQFRGFMECQVLEEPTEDELITAVTNWRPHIFHFTGHAEKPPGSAAFLQIGPQGAGWQFEAPDIPIAFQGYAGRLAVLNACRTDQGAPGAIGFDEAREASSSAAAAFRELGFPAVIGMQADIENGAAGRFGKVLYTSLSKRIPLDLAVAQARFAIYSNRGREERDWALPALTVSAAPESILAIRDCLAGRPNAMPLAKTKEFREINTFVNQYEMRRTAWLGVDPEGFLDLSPKGLIVVKGESLVGKTWLMYHCLRACAIRGRTVRLVDLSGPSPLGFLEVLRSIKDGTNPRIGGSPLRDALPSGSFSEFHHVLTHVAAGASDFQPYDSAMGDVPDPGLTFDRSTGDVEQRVKELFEAFWNGLSASGSGEPLILALDGLEGVEPTDFGDFVRPLLIKTIAETTDPPVRLIVALTDKLHKSLWNDELDTLSTFVDLKELELERFGSLFTEYLLASEMPWEKVKEARTKWIPVLSRPWLPVALKEFAQLAKRWTL